VPVPFSSLALPLNSSSRVYSERRGLCTPSSLVFVLRIVLRPTLFMHDTVAAAAATTVAVAVAVVVVVVVVVSSGGGGTIRSQTHSFIYLVSFCSHHYSTKLPLIDVLLINYSLVHSYSVRDAHFCGDETY